MRQISLRVPGNTNLLRALGTLLALALLVYLLSRQGWDEIESAIRQIALWRFAVAMALMIVSRLAVSGRWYVLLRSSGLKMTLGQSTRITFAGLFANNFLPTTVGGDVIRLAGALRFKYDATICTASLVVDRLVGMAGMAMTIPFGLSRFLDVNAAQQTLSGQSQILAAVAAAPSGKWWRLLWNKGLALLRSLFDALALWLKRPDSLFLALVFTWIHMLCLFVTLALLFSGMGEHISFWLLAGLYSVVYFVTLMPITINGYGLQELSMTFIFSHWGGASMASSLTGAVLFRTLLMLASLPGALFVPEMVAGLKQQPK
jgi:glycosyltransferase 2 family protein